MSTPKRRRQESCALCKAQPNEAAKRTLVQVKNASDDGVYMRCLVSKAIGCADFYQRALPWMSIATVVDLCQKDESFRDACRAGIDNLKAGTKDFQEEEVKTCLGQVVKAKEQCVFMNQAEFKSYFEVEPRKKYTKGIGVMKMVQRQSQDFEDVFVLQWHPSLAHLRKGSVSTYYKLERNAFVMQPDNHLFKDQGYRLFDH